MPLILPQAAPMPVKSWADSYGDIVKLGNQLEQQGMQNASAKNQLNIQPKQLQADLAYKQAQTPYVQSQTALNQATIPLLPEKFMAQGLMAQARMSQAMTGGSNSYRAWAQTDLGKKIIAENPQLAAQIEQQMIHEAQLSSGQQFGAPLPQGAPNTGLASPPPQQNQNIPAPTNQKLPMSDSDVNKLKQMFSVPDEKITKDVQNVADQSLLKKVTDPVARQKNLFATNIDKTLNQINVDDLTKYAGVYGGLDKLADKGLASINKEPKSYDNYQKALQATDYLSTQVRQFYGDSIQPSMLERLNKLSNPTTWSNNPKLAKELFNQTKKILDMETQTYRDAMKNTSVYTGKDSQGSAPDSGGMITIKTPDGRTGQIPANNLDHALKLGATQVQ